MRKLLLSSLTLMALLVTGCTAAEEQKMPEKTEEKKADQQMTDNQQTDGKLNNAVAVKNKNLINSFSYSNEIFNQRNNGKWQIEPNIVDGQAGEYTFSWVGDQGEPLDLMKVSTNLYLISGPNFNPKERKFYVQLAEANTKRDTETGGPTLEAQYLWSYDIDQQTEKVEKFNFRETPIEKWDDAENIILAVDDQGGVYTREDRPSESICSQEYAVDYYAPGSYGFGKSPAYQETSLTSCGFEVASEVKNQGKTIVSVDTNDELTEVKLTVGQKSKTLPVFKPQPDAKIEETANFSSMANGGVFMTENLDRGLFYYADTVVLFSVADGEINSIQDPLLMQNNAGWQNSYGWVGDDFFIFDAGKNQTKKINFAGKTFEILQGYQVPESASNKLNFIKKPRSACKKQNENFFDNSCFENSPYVSVGWNPMAY